MTRATVFRVVLVSFGLLLGGRAVAAQQPQPATGQPGPTIQPVLVQETGAGVVSPGGAFLRSVLVPGWGHVATESYARGGFYVAAQSGSLWMLWQTLKRRSEAAEYVRLERAVSAARFEAAGMSNPDSILIAVDGDPAVQNREALVDARSQQVEDWSALSIFLVLLGAADAFVAAHLRDFPEPLSLQVLPQGTDRAEIRISLPL